MGENLKSVIYGVFRRDGGDSDGVLSDFDRVRHNDGLCLGFNVSLAIVVLEGDTSAEILFGAEFPIVTSTWLLVYEDRASKRDKRLGIIVKGAVELLPSRYPGI